MAGKEGEKKEKSWFGELPKKAKIAIAVALLGAFTMIADTSLDAGFEFQIPWTDAHVTLVGGLGPKYKLHSSLPPWALSKLGPNTRNAEIGWSDGIVLGNFGIYWMFDVRNAPNDPMLDAGIGIK